MRSVVVVLPASICAMMPMFLHRSNGTVLGTSLRSSLGSLNSLPTIMCKRFVGFSHAVHIFFFLDRGTFAVGGIEQFVRELVNHTFFAAAAGIRDDPTDRERCTTVGIHFNRHLIVRAADAAGFYLKQ